MKGKITVALVREMEALINSAGSMSGTGAGAIRLLKQWAAEPADVKEQGVQELIAGLLLTNGALAPE